MADGERNCYNCRFARKTDFDDWVCANDSCCYYLGCIRYPQVCGKWESRNDA